MSETVYILTKTETQNMKGRLASVALTDAYTDFILSRQKLLIAPQAPLFFPSIVPAWTFFTYKQC
jgi:hypothetical protein